MQARLPAINTPPTILGADGPASQSENSSLAPFHQSLKKLSPPFRFPGGPIGVSPPGSSSTVGPSFA
jgi:hypothetical protein